MVIQPFCIPAVIIFVHPCACVRHQSEMFAPSGYLRSTPGDLETTSQLVWTQKPLPSHARQCVVYGYLL